MVSLCMRRTHNQAEGQVVLSTMHCRQEEEDLMLLVLDLSALSQTSLLNIFTCDTY